MTYSPRVAAYFKSDAWQVKRRARLRLDNYACRLCGETDCVLEVHHMLTAYVFIPNESVELHLISLCESCHQAIHAHFKRKKQEPW